MGQVDALKLVNDVRRRLVDLALSENYLRDNEVGEACRRIWDGLSGEGGLVSELWVEGAFPAESSGDTLESIVRKGFFSGTLCEHLDKPDCFPKSRNLFTHQAEALRITAQRPSNDKPALVVRAGTGAGKTEAFLLPVLQDLWMNPTRQKNGGMRCLILYPMNALIADQVERIYNWLMGQSQLSVFHFTSETPETASDANREGEPRWELCRKRTRQEARGVESHDGRKILPSDRAPVPDIVITNYSMLEYMLCRPQDNCFFGPDLRCIVLDEAHLYTGTLAAEITLLLRRVRDRCQVRPGQVLQIATSATLGGDEQDLRHFAATIFSTSENKTFIIQGRRAPLNLGAIIASPVNPPDPITLAAHSDLELTTLTPYDEFVLGDTTTVDRLQKVIRPIVNQEALETSKERFPDVAAPFLQVTLPKSPIVRRLAEILFAKNILSLEDLAGQLWGNADETTTKATILLLRLAAAARNEPKAMPILPHRLHFLVHAPEGLSVCLNPKCSGPPQYKLPEIGCMQVPSDRCRFCKGVTLPVHRCDTCGEWALAGHENKEVGQLEPGYFVKPPQRTYYLLARKHREDLAVIVVDATTGEYSGTGSEGTVLYKAPCPEHGGQCYDPEKCSRQICPTCKIEWSSGAEESDRDSRDSNCKPLRGAERIAISVLAETVLHGLPPFPDDTRKWKPGEGRRLLCFSDSRREAARLGPLLTSQHEKQVIRSAIARVAEGIESSDTASYWRGEIERHEGKLRDRSLPPTVRINVEQQLEEARKRFTATTAGISFPDFAKLFAQQPGVEQLLHREQGDKHKADGWNQRCWKENLKKVARHAEALIASELDGPRRTEVSIESIGLLEIAYPGLDRLEAPGEFLGVLPNFSCRDAIADVWTDLVAALLDTLRGDRIVGWGEDNEDRKWEEESPLYGLWATCDRNNRWDARAFVGDVTRPVRRRQLRLLFARSVLWQSGCPELKADELSKDLLGTVFSQLLATSRERSGSLFWIRSEDHQISTCEARPAIQILLDQLALRRPRALYRCPDTGTLWSRGVLGWTPLKGCQGNLAPISQEKADADARWGRARRELRDSPIFAMGLWSEEHSAQLSPEENKRRQLLFKKGVRNILSSTTTMELGIDIGGLNGVLMGNVPPGRANHLQRAGRAGRRTDGSAIVVTYARGRAFDREVFHRFGDFLNRDLRRPLVFLERERIVRRHIHALLLSEFISPMQPGRVGAMGAYGFMGDLCGVEAPPRWDERTKPTWSFDCPGYDEQFLNFLETLKVEGETIRQRFANVAAITPLEGLGQDERTWSAFIDEAISQFRGAVEEWRNDIQCLLDAWQEISNSPAEADVKAERAKANAVRYQIKGRCDLAVIEWLADARFLPRYGFPINLQRLVVRVPKEERSDKSRREGKYRLERPSMLALSEYVPGADVLVGGKVAVSRGILKHWADANRDQALGLHYWALICGNEHTYLATSQEERCRECGEPPSGSGQMLLFPRFGYSTAAWEPLQRGKHLERVGEVIAYPIAAFTADEGGQVIDNNFAGVQGLRLIYREEAELLLRNAGDEGLGFAVCTKCGFSMSEEEAGQSGLIKLPEDFKTHASIFHTNRDRGCWKKGEAAPPVLRNKVLAARERTDMLLLDWPNVAAQQEAGLFSLGRALLLAGSRLLEVDSRELDLVLKPLADGRKGIILYDTVPGGAGHCLEFTQLGRKWLEEARNILHGTDEHHERCRRACIDCLLDFAGQFYVEKLDRCAALEILQVVF